MQNADRNHRGHERQKLIEEGRKKAADDAAEVLKERDEELAEVKGRLEVARHTELDLRKKERELQQKAEDLELTVNRRLGEERDRVRADALKQAADEHQLKDAEKDKKITDLVKQLDEMKRKAEQGSQQTQGEVLELAMEGLLREAFPTDRIEEVPKGVRGGDLIQRVMTPRGLDCGTIIWEAKRAKKWQGDWLPKLRQDQREAKAELSVLVSDTLPDGITYFDFLEEVYVCTGACVRQVAGLLREGLIEASRARRALEGQQGKMEQVYNYLASPAFRNRVNGMLEPIVRMQVDLAAEKRAIQTHWARREKQIDQAILGAGGMYGDFQGIIGGSLPELEIMSISQLENSPGSRALPEPVVTGKPVGAPSSEPTAEGL